MVRWIIIGVPLTVALMSTAGVAAADPVAPQPDASCTASLEGAMTWPTGAKVPLACDGTSWEQVADPYPISDTWLSYGPVMTLHGQGRRNPTLESGDWTATPLTPESVCGATQLAVIPGSPTTGAPVTNQGQAGRPLTLVVVPRLFSIEMTGDCLWQRSG